MKVIVSNKTENLFKHLVGSINQILKEQSLLKPVIIVVPNRNVERYLSFSLAHEFPVVMNFHFPFLEVALKNFISNILYEKKYQLKPNLSYFLPQKDNEITFISKKTFQILILKELLKSPSTYFKEYLNNLKGKARENMAYQLSKELSYLFLEYQYHRPWYLSHLQNNPEEIDPEAQDQLQLLFKLRQEISQMAYEDIFSGFEKLKIYLEGKFLDEKISFFALGQISKFHYEFLLFLSQYLEITIYQLLPHPQESFFDLKSWAKASQNNWKLFSELASKKNIKYDLIDAYEENTFPKIKFLEFKSELDSESKAPYSKRQEVELVAFQIIDLLKKQVPPQKIAVLVPDLNEYLGIIRAVFSQTLPEIPYNIADAQLSIVSQFAQGIFSLLNILEGPFNRKNLFDLFENPCFLSRFNLLPNDIEEWLNFAETLKVFSGATSTEFYANDEKKFGPPRDWNRALEKARLNLLFPESYSSNSESYLIFLEVVEKLRRNYLKFKEISKAKDLLENFWDLVLEFLDIPLDLPVESFAQKEIEKLFLELSEFLEKNEENFPLSLALFKKILQNEIEDLPLIDRRQMVSGVSIGKLNPMRPIPYDYVFLLGLNEGIFPKSESMSYLDLRQNFLAAEKEDFAYLSDLTPRDKDFQLIYDVLLSTRKELYLSYCGYDLLKDVEKIPSEPYRKLKKYGDISLFNLTSVKILSEDKIQEHEIKTKISTTKVEEKATLNVAIQIYSVSDIKNFLERPLFFYLRKEKLKTLDFGKSIELREKEFEDDSLEDRVNLQILEKCFYLTLQEKKGWDEDTFKKILERQIYELKENLDFPYGLFSEEAENILKEYSETLINQINSLKDIDYAKLTRFRLGFWDKRFNYLNSKPFLEIKEGTYLAGITPFYYILENQIVILAWQRKSYSSLFSRDGIKNFSQLFSTLLPIYGEIQNLTLEPKVLIHEINLKKQTKLKNQNKVGKIVKLNLTKFKEALSKILLEMQKKEIDTFLWDEELEKFDLENHELYEKIKINWQDLDFWQKKSKSIDLELLIQGVLPFHLKENTLKKYKEIYSEILEIAHLV